MQEQSLLDDSSQHHGVGRLAGVVRDGASGSQNVILRIARAEIIPIGSGVVVSGSPHTRRHEISGERYLFANERFLRNLLETDLL